MEILENDKNISPDEFYASLKEKLDSGHNFPEDYLFKFIIPNDQAKLTDIYRVFDGVKYTLTSRDSKNGKYTSANLNAFMLDSDHVIRMYKEVAKIEGVMML